MNVRPRIVFTLPDFEDLQLVGAALDGAGARRVSRRSFELAGPLTPAGAAAAREAADHIGWAASGRGGRWVEVEGADTLDDALNVMCPEGFTAADYREDVDFDVDRWWEQPPTAPRP